MYVHDNVSYLNNKRWSIDGGELRLDLFKLMLGRFNYLTNFTNLT